MTCADVERVLPEILEDAPESDRAFPSAFAIHLRSCEECSSLVADLRMISRAARELTESDEPSPRVWARIAVELRAEGIIREPETRRERPRKGLGAWWLVPVATVLLAVGAYVVNHKPAPAVAKRQPTALPATPSEPDTAKIAAQQEPVQAPPQVADNAKQASNETSKRTSRVVEAAPSQEDQQFLSEVSTRAPSMRVTYRDQLQAVNAEILEVQNYLQQNPDDADARQHLMDAYQQKALLYQIALDRIQ